MAIAEQFAGLDMGQLIGGPLSAAADASMHLANSTAEFIDRIGFDGEGKVRTATFGYQKRSTNDDGTSNLDQLAVNVPMLAIVPIPNLQVDEVNIFFDMEVKQSEKSEQTSDMSGSLSGGLNLGLFKVNVTGSVSSHSTNTRSTDNSAKYHVDVRATNHGVPEGLARVLDMIAANVAPVLVESSLRDGNGQTLPEQARIRAEKLKALRLDISQIENRLAKAKEGYDTCIGQLKQVGVSQRNAYQLKLTTKMNEIDLKTLDDKVQTATETEKPAAIKKKEEAEAKLDGYNQMANEINQSWNAFLNGAGDMVKMIADSKEELGSLAQIFGLKAFSDATPENEGVIAYGANESYYAAFTAASQNAVESRKKIQEIETELYEKKTEYTETSAKRIGTSETKDSN